MWDYEYSPNQYGSGIVNDGRKMELDVLSPNGGGSLAKIYLINLDC